MDNLIIKSTSGKKEIVINEFDSDKEVCIEITGQEVERIYLSTNQINEIVDYLMRQLKAINEYDTAGTKL